MRVLTLNWGGRNTGSIDKIRKDIEKSLHQNNVHFMHVYESGQIGEGNYRRLSGWLESHVYYVWGHLSGRRYGTGYLPYLKFKRIVAKFHPDIVHVHCPNGFGINMYKVFRYLGRKNIPVVITNHAEFFYTGNCSYAKECQKFVNGCNSCHNYKKQCASVFFDRSEKNWKEMKSALHSIQNIVMVAVSPWVFHRLSLSGISKDLACCIIENGIDTTIFRYREDLYNDCMKMYPELSLEHSKRLCKRVLYVTSLFSLNDNDLKGGRYVVELAERLERDRVEFVVVGNINISDQQRYDLPANIILIDAIWDQNMLANIYSMCDLCVLVSRRETFGMTCAESLCCGTSVVGFKNGGSDSIAMEEYSHFYEYGDLEGLEDYIRYFEPDAVRKKQMISLKAGARYSKERMAADYYVVYQELCKNSGK